MAPALTYKDLSGDDIAQLTQLLSQTALGQPQLLSNYSWNPQARQDALFGRLPGHLKRRVPCMAPGCPQHKRLNLALLDDLAKEFKHELTHSVRTIWRPLQQSGSFTPEQDFLLDALGGPSTLDPNSCSACWLEFGGSHIDASVALGAFIIGRINPSIYKKSKRLIWIEGMLRQKMPKAAAEAEIKRMWETGMQFRQLRKDLAVHIGEGRSYVAEYVRRAKEMDGSSGRQPIPAESTRTKESAIAVNSWLKDLPIDDSAEAEANPPVRLVRRKPVPRAADRPPPKPATAPPLAAEHQQDRIASSIYTGRVSAQEMDCLSLRTGESSWWANSLRSKSTAPSLSTQIIDLYHHSFFPKDAAFDTHSSTDSRKRSPIVIDGQENSPSRHDSLLQNEKPQDEVILIAPPKSGETIRQRRAASRGINEMLNGGQPHVNTTGGLRGPKMHKIEKTEMGYFIVRIDGR